MSSNHKAKWCGEGLETEVSSGRRCSEAVSGQEMCITKVSALQNESEANGLEVHKLLWCCFKEDVLRKNQIFLSKVTKTQKRHNPGISSCAPVSDMSFSELFRFAG